MERLLVSSPIFEALFYYSDALMFRFDITISPTENAKATRTLFDLAV